MAHVRPRLPRLRRAARIAAPLLVALAGSWLGMALWGRSTVAMGPFQVRLEAGFGRGVTEIALPPFGSLTADTHRAPIRLTGTLVDVRVKELTERLSGGGSLDVLADEVKVAAIERVGWFVVRLFLATLVATLALALLTFRGRRRPIEIALVAWLVVMGGSLGGAALSYRTDAFESPTFSGSLALAPQVIGPVRTATQQIDRFRAQLERVVDGAINAYTSIRRNPLGRADEIRVLHISDIHISPLGYEFAQQIAEGYDVNFVLDTGDTTSFGTPVEDLILTYIPGFHRPYVWVRGNHDAPSLEREIAQIPRAYVLDGRAVTLNGITMYGLGHPNFLTNRSQNLDLNAFAEEARAAGQRVLRDVLALPEPPDIVAVHDDRMAEAVAGRVPLVVSGHFHENAAKVVDGTLYLRLGTTGGAGPVTFTPEGGVPLSAEVLYFAPGSALEPPELLAYDLIVQDPQTGSLTVTRHVIEQEFGTLTPSPGPTGTPTVSPT